MSEKEQALKVLQEKIKAGKAGDITFDEARKAFAIEMPDIGKSIDDLTAKVSGALAKLKTDGWLKADVAVCDKMNDTLVKTGDLTPICGPNRAEAKKRGL